MPALQNVLMYLNQAFNKKHIRQLAEHREVFAPGAQLSAALQVIIDDDGALLEVVGPARRMSRGNPERRVFGTVDPAADPGDLCVGARIRRGSHDLARARH